MLYIEMRPENCHPCITFFLDTQAESSTDILRGLIGVVMEVYLQFNYLSNILSLSILQFCVVCFFDSAFVFLLLCCLMA